MKEGVYIGNQANEDQKGTRQIRLVAGYWYKPYSHWPNEDAFQEKKAA